MKIKVDHEICIGCGMCESTYPGIFICKDEDDGKASSLQPEVSKENEENALDAVDICPVGAIEVE